MALRRAPQPQKGYINRRGAITFCHQMTLTAAGVITTQDTDSGLTATKQGTAGQYVIAPPAPSGVGTAPTGGYKKTLDFNVVLIGAAGATTAGLPWTLTVNTPATPTWTIQFIRPDTNAAADLPSGMIVIFNIEVSEGL